MLKISENTLIKILKYGVYASLAWFFIVTPYSLHPAHLGKVLFLQGLIAVLFVFYVFLILKYPQYRPKLNLMTGAIAIWGVALIISAIFGADSWISVFSQLKRMTGLFFLSHIFVFFLIMTAVFRTWSDWRNFFIANVAVGLVQALIALYQRINPILSWLGDVVRVSGLFGNPSFLASYLLFVFFLALILFFKSEDLKLKIFSGFSLIVVFGAILFAGTRGTILGVFAGLLVLFAILAIFNENKKLRVILGVLLAIVLFSGVFLWYSKNKPWLDGAPVLKRAANITWAEFATSTRRMMWEAALKGFKDEPIFGWGSENFNLVFDKYYNPQILNYGTGESWPTKPHNIYLEHLATGGIVGFLSFFAIFTLAFYVLFKRFQKNRQSNLFIFSGISSLLFAHLVQNAVLFDTPYTYYMLFIIFGFIASLSEPIIKNNTEKKLFVGKDYENAIMFLVSALALFLIFMYTSTYRTSVLANHFNLRFLDKVSFYKDDFRRFYVKSYLDELFDFKNKEEKQVMFEKMNLEFSDMLARHPLSIFDRGYKIQILTELGATSGEYLNEAENLVYESLKLSPNRQHSYLLLGRINFIRKDYNKAVKNFERSVELNPESAMAHWYLGITHYFLKDTLKAMEEFDFAYAKGFRPENPTQLSLWALIYAENKAYDKALQLYYEAINKDPGNYEYLTKVAVIYKELGNKELAIGMANRAADLNPDLKEEAEIFKKQVERELK